jgi:proline iminopeptidase
MDRRKFLIANAACAAGVALTPLAGSLAAAPSRPLPDSAEVQTGGSRMVSVGGGKYRVWTKRVGRGRIKMLTLHGGPGFNHEYLECLEDFLPQEGIEFYYYDQLGSSYSDQPDDPTLWTVPRFVEEVEEVRAALGLDNFYLYGHSWGGMLGIEYLLKYGHHVKGYVHSNMVASVPGYAAYTANLRKALPPEVITVLDRYEATGDYENAEYQQAMMAVYARHLCRLDPWPEPLERAFRHVNTQVYNTMQGPNEFVITGNFKDWDRWNDLHRITVPTLVLAARHDEMNPEDMKRQSELMPRARFALCENGSHCAMYDDQAAYFNHLITFVRDVEAGAAVRS